jgi:hypothetical protein
MAKSSMQRCRMLDVFQMTHVIRRAALREYCAVQSQLLKF